MEIMDVNEFINKYILHLDTYLVSLFGLLILFIIVIFISKILRLYYNVSVNCWFCNANLKINYNKRNQFICPSCSQYNGFKDDGSYNCTIDAQHDIFKNVNIYQNFKKSSKETYNFGNNLCETCNIQQSLKVRALAEFSSITEDSSEIEDFKNKLEEMYDLCQQCEATVHQVLGKQNSLLKPKLIAWRVLKSKNLTNLIIPKENIFSSKTGYQIFLSITSLYLIVSKLMVCFLTSPLSPIQNFNPIAGNWLIYILKVDILLAMVGLEYVCILCSHSSTYAKIKVPCNLLGWFILVLLHNDINTGFLNDVTSYYLQLFVALLNFLMSTHSSEKTAKQSKSKSLIFTPKIQLSPPKVERTSNTQNGNFISSETVKNKIVLDDEIGVTLNNLKIGTSHNGTFTSSNNAGVSATQNQFGPNRNCFSDTSSQRSRNILQQPKFASKITQSSWVAGGYWGESPKRRQPSKQSIPDLNKRNDEFDLFSRASSKSSGFVSQTSEPGGLYYAQYINPANIPRQNLSSRFGSCDEKKSMDSLDACSVSSCYSTVCSTERQQFNDWKSSQCSLHSVQGDLRASSIVAEAKLQFSWWYTCLAFVLGFSISTNLFLFFAFYKSDLIHK